MYLSSIKFASIKPTETDRRGRRSLQVCKNILHQICEHQTLRKREDNIFPYGIVEHPTRCRGGYHPPENKHLHLSPNSRRKRNVGDTGSYKSRRTFRIVQKTGDLRLLFYNSKAAYLTAADYHIAVVQHHRLPRCDGSLRFVKNHRRASAVLGIHRCVLLNVAVSQLRLHPYR